MRLRKNDRVALIHDPKWTIGTIIHCKGKLAEVKWTGKKRIHLHRKDCLAKVGDKNA